MNNYDLYVMLKNIVEHGEPDPFITAHYQRWIPTEQTIGRQVIKLVEQIEAEASRMNVKRMFRGEHQ